MSRFNEFTCPECGSNKFGSYVRDGILYGSCHGYVSCHRRYSEPCAFTWDRKDDEKYFSVSTIREDYLKTRGNF